MMRAKTRTVPRVVVLLVIGALSMFGTEGRAQTLRGSLVVEIVSKRADYVVIGAESRQLDVGSNTFDDRSCKIISLGGDTLFYETGDATVSVKRGANWSSQGAARSVYAAMQTRDAADLASAWGNNALRWFYAQPQRELQSLAQPPHGSLVIGGFVNFNDRGVLSLRSAEISFDAGKGTVAGRSSTIRAGRIGVAGIAQELVKEFFDGKTERAVRASGAGGATRLIAVDPDRDVALVRKAIQFAIDNASAEEKQALGGDIDIAIIGRDRKIRWISRKPGCSQQDAKAIVAGIGPERANPEPH